MAVLGGGQRIKVRLDMVTPPQAVSGNAQRQAASATARSSRRFTVSQKPLLIHPGYDRSGTAGCTGTGNPRTSAPAGGATAQAVDGCLTAPCISPDGRTIIRRHFAIYFLPHRGSLR